MKRSTSTVQMAFTALAWLGLATPLAAQTQTTTDSGDAAAADVPNVLLCAVRSSHECTSTEGCATPGPAALGVPPFLLIDLTQALVTDPRAPAESAPISQIDGREIVDRTLFLTGIDPGEERVRDGLAWSLGIDLDDASMVVSGSSDGAGFVLLGNCLAMPTGDE